MSGTQREDTYQYSHGEHEPLGRVDVVAAWLVAAFFAAGLMLAG